ncbi:DUF5787 family protein [Halovenus carboxidivorans]|uniref:DUF5787 family protein n=1 Tax=Halovenus carboxidivorans TaxID=2692199 RepID=UPI0034A4545D
MDSEFGFELSVCQWAEECWPPGRERERPVLVARQLGTRRRRWDTLVIECNAEGLRQRADFGSRRLDSDLLHVVRNAPAEWEWYRDCLPDPGYPWRYVREAVHRAADRDLIEERTSGNRIELRRRFRYPDWIERIVAIENKPDLDASAARHLADQLHSDVALALGDEVWVATNRTDDAVAPVLLEDLPVEAGILGVDPQRRGPEAVSVRWNPQTLPTDTAGTRILDRPDASGHDASACRFEYADPEWKAHKRREIAERAYERGWRSYVDSMRSDCRHFEMDPTEAVARPTCRAKDCQQTPRQCSSSCEAFEPEPPAWRQRGWPIEGGPGKGLTRVLDRQRRRQRPDPD